MTTTTHRFVLPLLLFVGIGVIASGCMPVGATTRNERRYPDSRRAPSRAERVIYTRVANDADRYVRTLDRSLRLNRRQEQRIVEMLSDRAYDRVRRTRTRDRDRAYPFPRRFDDRATRDWWRDADRGIERELNRRQRAVYRDLVREYERRADRNQPRSNGRGQQRGRGNGRG